MPPQVLKLAQLAEALRAGASFNITRLTSIKRLCREASVAQRFVVHLLHRAFPDPNRIKGKPIEKELARSAIREMSARVAGEDRHSSHRDLAPLLREIEAQQSEFKRLEWGPVRIIRNNDLLLVENALRCFVEDWSAPFWAYHTARQHAERYDSSWGTGLIPASANAVQDIADFWLKPSG